MSIKLTAVTIKLSEDQMQDKNGKNLVRTLMRCMFFLESTIEILESWETHANLVPSGEKATL